MTDISVSSWRLTACDGPDQQPPLIAACDVIVVGAGAAGVAAATVAAEGGASVILLEKYGFAGGAAVAGMSGTVCGMYLASDDETAAPRQIVHGFTERFTAELSRRHGLTAPQKYGKTYTSAHDPLIWKESADRLLESAGVRILFHTDVIGVTQEAGTVTGVIVASNAGLGRITARRIVDASGDAAVITRAGGDYWFGDHGRIQNPTMFFRLGGVDAKRFWEAYGDDTICPPWVSERIGRARDAGADLPRTKIWIFDSTRPGELLVNATRLTARDGRMLNVIDPEDFTIAEIDGRRQVRAYARFIAENLPGCDATFVVDTGTEAGIRQTRTIAGVQTLRNDDVVNCVKPPDGIVRSPWPIELHDGDRPKLVWLLDDWYEVPFATLVPQALENVIAAGRCLSAEHEALASARVTAQCFEYGHAAGVATLLSLDSDRAYRDLPGTEVRRTMIKNGSLLDEPAVSDEPMGHDQLDGGSRDGS